MQRESGKLCSEKYYNILVSSTSGLSKIISHKFITTECFKDFGESAEQLVWTKIQAAFTDRICLGYWRYPIFCLTGKTRKEPDILIADFRLGLIIIEVKSLTLDQITNISGHRWQLNHHYTPFIAPYQQAEKQLFSLLDYTNREPTLYHKIPSRALIALPNVTQEQWQTRGFHELPNSPPILFKNHLHSPENIIPILENISPLISENFLTPEQWELLLSILSGTPVFLDSHHRVLSSPQSRGKILEKLRSHLSQFDLEQEIMAKQIPQGCQRIRGIAGSGKTVILCQKAVIMHLKHPDWKIALVFFSRSLYDPLIQQVNKWLNYFTNNTRNYDPKNSNLLILHAWGSQEQIGLYRLLSQQSGVPPLSVKITVSQQPSEALAEVCSYLLKETVIPQLFDALLIDEGQDLIVDHHKFEDKQPFYWMAYQSLRPCDPLHPEQKRLIWAYDEGQSLESLKIPTASELFGENLGHLVTGNHPNNIPKSIIMRRCYRTPHPIITFAHGLSMGVLRTKGMLTGMTRKSDWEAIGYQVEGQFISGKKITLKRPLENSPNPLPNWWQDSLINFQIYSTRQEEFTAIYQQIMRNLKQDGLRPSREILIIILGNFWDAIKLETHLATFLMRQGIDIYIPGCQESNMIKPQKEPNKFWCDGAVTLSRIHRAKGQEADMIYVVGLDHIAKDESNIYLRNQLFVALTRARGWVNLSGIGDYELYEEVKRVIGSGDTFEFIFRRPPQREINNTETGELLRRYALGGRNFQNIDLEKAHLVGVSLKKANLIGANLRKANLEKAQLDEVKLIMANLEDANLKGASLRKAKLIGANLQGANLAHADLTGADLTDTDLTYANVEGALF